MCTFVNNDFHIMYLYKSKRNILPVKVNAKELKFNAIFPQLQEKIEIDFHENISYLTHCFIISEPDPPQMKVITDPKQMVMKGSTLVIREKKLNKYL